MTFETIPSASTADYAGQRSQEMDKSTSSKLTKATAKWKVAANEWAFESGLIFEFVRHYLYVQIILVLQMKVYDAKGYRLLFCLFV